MVLQSAEHVLCIWHVHLYMGKYWASYISQLYLVSSQYHMHLTIYRTRSSHSGLSSGMITLRRNRICRIVEVVIRP